MAITTAEALSGIKALIVRTDLIGPVLMGISMNGGTLKEGENPVALAMQLAGLKNDLVGSIEYFEETNPEDYEDGVLDTIERLLAQTDAALAEVEKEILEYKEIKS